MSTLSITLDSCYSYVLLGCVVLAFQCLMESAFVGKLRNKYFNKEFLEKNFGEEHKKAFGRSVPKGGYPDVGNGRYSDKLSYEEWFHFNNAQRAHQNFLEMLTPVIVFALVAGLVFTKVTAGFLASAIVGRVFYGMGYRSNKGADGRLVGVIFYDIALFGLFFTAVASGLKLCNCL
eukprot:GILI01005241.1.p2 GENE.GILI01005241.1~~GILI01005241.1.p2  ORF type:complete len:191 (-),score=70.56 GILI01005241.1:94-621(-)